MFTASFNSPTSHAIEASQQDDANRYDEIVQLLVAAGYFRARIAALSPFDKVVGGMAWCMTATSIDVDVAFIENATIGQKIKIGEGIERALRQMKCRIPLQAHQIQGLDYAAIFPVVQWLVKQAYAFREEIADATRRLSESHFHRHHFSLPSDSELAARRQTALPTAHQIGGGYGPSRKFRPKADAAAAQPVPAIHARRVLMEYGAQLSAMQQPVSSSAGGGAGGGSAADGSATQRTKQATAGAAADDASAVPTGGGDAATAAIAADLAEANEEGELNKSRVGKLVRLGANDIVQAAAEFARKSEQLALSGEMAGVHKLRSERDAAAKQLEQVKKELAVATAKAQAASEGQAAAEVQKSRGLVALDKQAKRKAAAAADMAELETLAAEAPQDELAKLQSLVALNDKLTSQKAEFKRSCAAQLSEMQAELAALQSTSAATADEETARLAEIEALFDAEEGKAGSMRRLVGQKGREISSLARQVDDVPTSAELMQYERRFRELFAQVASTLEETRRYYALFNTLAEKKGYLAKEVSLLNSLHENFTKAVNSGSNKDKIVESVEAILKSVNQTLAKSTQRLNDGKAVRDTQQQKYDKLVEKQRKYFQLVADYQAECEKNARMSEQLEGATPA